MKRIPYVLSFSEKSGIIFSVIKCTWRKTYGKNQSTSEYRLLSKLYFHLLPYQVLLIVISAVNGIVDSIYASNLIGESAMSAIGLFGPINHFLYAASMVFVSGSQILYGRYLANEREKINGLISVDLLVSGGIGLAVSLLMGLGVLTGSTRVFIHTEPELQMLNSYILGQAVGIPALLLGQQLFSFLSLENRKKLTMTASIVCFAANVVLNHVFIVFLGMGTFGLGLSTALSTWLFLGVQAMYYLRGKSEWKISPRNCRWADAGKIFTLGYSGALSRFVEMFRCLIVNALILQYVGNVGLSSFAASNSVLAVIWAVPFGMVAVARMLFSISIGEEDRRSLVNVFKIAMTRGIALMAVIVALLIAGAEPLTRLFYRDPADPVYFMTVMGFRIMPLCMLLSTFSLHFAFYAQAAEKKVMSLVLPICDGMIGVVIFSFILIPAMQMNSLYLSNILNGVFCALVVLAGAWIHRKRFPRGLEQLMDIPDRIGTTEDARMDISVRGMDEVLDVSRRIIDFCIGRGIDRRKAFFAGLCMEEMAGNVVNYGFENDDKSHSVDIRVIHKNDQLVLRIRDNCRQFNPTDYTQAMQPGDLGKNVGIRLVLGVSESVSYQNLLGMNVLTIRF